MTEFETCAALRAEHARLIEAYDILVSAARAAYNGIQAGLGSPEERDQLAAALHLAITQARRCRQEGA